VDAFVAQSEPVGHLEFAIRQHNCTESVLGASLRELARGVGADRQDLHTTQIEVGPEFFPSPQLGDTVGSPVSTKKLDENWMSRKAL
jgi:hypothetical protein